VNDTLGHDAGDALLQETATRLQATVREGDTVARLGGDEFVVVVRAPLTLADALSLAETILGEMRRPFAYKDHLISCRASIGIAACPDHDTNPGELMKDADLALYAAKGKGRNRACVYQPAMRDAMQRRVVLARELQEAVAGDQIVPFYQPKICLSTGAVVGFEALARWRHPRQGVLTPDHFASGFQDPELAVALGEQMLARIAGDVRDWAARGMSFGRVAINLSAAQFAQADLAGRFFAILEAQGANPKHFDVEVTETVFLGKSSDYVAAALEEFHRRGVRIALDDFGTGYASLTHLKQFPVDDIKIDQSFVRDIEHDAGDRAIVSAVIDLGRNLGLQVIAEGVETEGQARYLLARGCNHAQGFLYAKPMTGSRVPWFLTECAPGLLRACPDLQMTAW
jgi:diguanylate cyclase (GGDEF)-like protein